MKTIVVEKKVSSKKEKGESNHYILLDPDMVAKILPIKTRTRRSWSYIGNLILREVFNNGLVKV